MAEASTPKQDKRTSIIDFITHSILVIVASLILSIIVEWVGMIFWWPEQGSLHSLNMLNNEINFINDGFSSATVFNYKPVDLINYAYSTFYDVNDKEGAVNNFLRWVNEPNTSNVGAIEAFFKGTGYNIKEFLLSAFYIFLVFIIRLSILLLSLPLFILVTVLALIDGFAQRDIRRWQNGRESGFRYHYAKALALPSFFIVWVLYLSIPFSIHPNFLILPLAIVYGYVIREMVSWFKKYL
jgi:integrating conjugative element membrane protein (TIGR03747 family)